jgi:hypothetical protein
MPVFRTTPSQSLSASVRRMVASGGPKVGALNEITADAAAARTARDLSLADKARLEVEAMQQANARATTRRSRPSTPRTLRASTCRRRIG